MPMVPPYAKALAQINGGVNQSGGIEPVPSGATVQLVPESTVGWTQARWEFVDYPEGWTPPAGWELDADGTTIFNATVGSPPAFTLPSAASRWGKYALRLRVNEQVSSDARIGDLLDESLILSMLSPGKLIPDISAKEDQQFTTPQTRHKRWVRTLQRILRKIEAISGGEGGGTEFTAAGDLSGDYTTQTVEKVHGASVPVAGTLVPGNVLKVTGVASLGYSAVNLGGGDNHVIGVLPEGNQEDQTLAGDVQGPTSANTVYKIRGVTIVDTPVGGGKVLKAIDATSASWQDDATGGSGGGSAVGTAGQVQTALDGSGAFAAPANVRAGANFLAVGAAPATAGAYRVGYSSSFQDVLVGKKADGGNTTLLSFDPSNLAIGEYGGKTLFANGLSVVDNASVQKLVYVANILRAAIGETQAQWALPRLGLASPYASEGEIGIHTVGNYTLTNTEYIYSSIVFDGLGTGTYTFPAPIHGYQAYYKLLEEIVGYARVITVGGGATFTLQPYTKRWVKFTARGVFAADAGGASQGVAGQANYANGAGGWTPWSGVTGGSSFIAIDSTATSGNFRVPSTGTIMKAGFLNVISWEQSSVVRFGDFNGLTSMPGTVHIGGFATTSSNNAALVASSANVAFGRPRIGLNAPYASEGYIEIATSSTSYELGPSEYSMAHIAFTTALTATYHDVILPNPTNGAAYRKWIKAPFSNNGYNRMLRVKAGTGSYEIPSPGWHELVIANNRVEPLAKSGVASPLINDSVGLLGDGRYEDRKYLKNLTAGPGIRIESITGSLIKISALASPGLAGQTADPYYDGT